MRRAQLLTTTRGKIVQLLRRAARTVNDLARALGLTDNAVRSHLAQLERDGLVEQTGLRPSFRKPESVFDITPVADALFAKAYAPVLGNLLSAMETRLDEKEMDTQLREVGHRLAAPHLPQLAALPLQKRVKRTLQILEELGGLAEIEQREGRTFVRGCGCPFSQIVGEHPKLCRVAEVLVSDLLGRKVQEQCQREGRPRCCFLVN